MIEPPQKNLLRGLMVLQEELGLVQGVSEVTPVLYFEVYKYFCKSFLLNCFGD
jgi:hypothetical protein